ncbi:MAG: thioredoxin domain-containing protein [Candidatus Ozemobacteraceae bacterium]
MAYHFSPHFTNRLADEKSPYLRQHAQNPVNWFPWGDEAFEASRRENKPIFLSIGYSTCHWCHVMAHESFEDPEVAQLMNDNFISIKVDREERPDIDHLYMNVCQILTGGGGWPLTIFLLPDRRPFFAGTYFPKHSRFRRVGMVELIGRIRLALETKSGQLEQSATELVSAIQQVAAVGGMGKPLTEEVLDLAFKQLVNAFDEKNGGFGDAPKFPTPHNLMFLLRFGKRTDKAVAGAMVEKTLLSMRQGGLYDQIGFGFHRYSVNSDWKIPHFEKMLYDQALLILAYLEAWQVTRNPLWSQTVREIFSYVGRDLTSPEGVFYSAEDADSEGFEGQYYLWKLSEIRDLLDTSDSGRSGQSINDSRINADLKTEKSVYPPYSSNTMFFQELFYLTEEGNFSEIGHPQEGGLNVISQTRSMKEVAVRQGISETDVESRFEVLRKMLFKTRCRRVRPHRDEKILTDWNGLMIAALARGARVLNSSDNLQQARRAADFILKKLVRSDGRLLHRYYDGEAGIQALLDDYAFFIWGLIELYESSFEPGYLADALVLTRQCLDHFWDAEQGGFFLSADDAEKLLVRSKEIYDGATPSGNSVMTLNLLRLSRLTGDPSLEERAAILLRAFSRKVGSVPMAHTHMLMALSFALGPVAEIVITGTPEAPDTNAMVSSIREEFLPDSVILFRPTESDKPDSQITQLAPFCRGLHSIEGKATAYICRDFTCSTPITDPASALKILKTAPGKAIV